MARYILLLILVFIGIVFFFTALKGVIRRLSGFAPKHQQPKKQPESTDESEVIFKNTSTTVLKGEAKRNP